MANEKRNASIDITASFCVANVSDVVCSSPFSSRILYTTEYVFPRCLINAMLYHSFPVLIQPVQELLPVNPQNLSGPDTLEFSGLHD